MISLVKLLFVGVLAAFLSNVYVSANLHHWSYNWLKGWKDDKWGKDKHGYGYDYGKDKHGYGYDYGKDKHGNGYDYGKDKHYWGRKMKNLHKGFYDWLKDHKDDKWGKDYGKKDYDYGKKDYDYGKKDYDKYYPKKDYGKDYGKKDYGKDYGKYGYH